MKSLKTMCVTLLAAAALVACGKGAEQRSESPDVDTNEFKAGEVIHGTEVTEVELTNPLNAEMVKKGEEIYEMKCLSCHKLDDTKLVGPGWKNVTKRRNAVWLTNMITNVDIMLEEDPEAQKMLEECLIRMPNQNISLEESRALIEFMRKNDGEI